MSNLIPSPDALECQPDAASVPALQAYPARPAELGGGLIVQSKEAEKERFFALASRLAETRDSAERQRLKEELARMTFGDCPKRCS
jgi:hypothetical protein